MNKKTVVVITTGWFPEGDAGAVRLRMMGRALIDGGYSVSVLCRGKANDFGIIDGIHYQSLRTKEQGTLSKLFDYLFFPKRTRDFLKLNQKHIGAIYIYNAHESVFKYCKKYCEKTGIKLFHDCVEWYSPEEYKLGRFDPWYRSKNRINSKIIDSKFKIIAITRYLENYFQKKGISTIRVPILCDSKMRMEPKEKHSGDTLTVFYGGLPGTKDLVGNLLEAALLLEDEEKAKLRIIIVGATAQYLENVSGVNPQTMTACSKFLTLCGRVSRQEVLQKMEEADFAFLARDAKLRYAQAGFPSKVVEALSNATPVLCNITSDLSDYLIDGYNALICKDHSPESISIALKKALSLSVEEKQRLSINALETAKRKFDYRSYVNLISDFFSQ